MQIQQNWLYLFYLPPVNKKDVYIMSKQPVDKWLQVLSKGLGNDDKMPCTKTLTE